MHTTVSIIDTTADPPEGVAIDTVLLKVVSRCNINCDYCYVYNMGDNGWASMPNLMSRQTFAAVGDSLRELYANQRRAFAVVLHGGEPLLLGEEALDFALSTLRGAIGSESSLCIQTNGILITRGVLDICSRYETTLSVSLDGPADLHNKHRLGHNGRGTHRQVVAGIDRLRHHPDSKHLYSGLLAVVDPDSDPASVYHYLKQYGAPKLDFLYKDGNHSSLPSGKHSIESTEYGLWLASLFDVYIYDRHPTPIRVLDDMVKLALGGAGTKEGVGLTDYGIVVIDTDGTLTKNDTLKSAYDGADRFGERWSVHLDALKDIRRRPAFREYHALQHPSSPVCLTCPELAVCGGGMPAHRWADDTGYDNPSVYCSDQKMLIRHIRQRLTSYTAH